MEAYTGFAEVYDKFMDNIDYPMWCHYLCELLKDNGVETGTLVELGCGTGNVTMGLAKEGYNIIGTDISPEMLGIAFEKLTDEVRNNILYVAMDMRELELPCQVAAAVSICDSINYITEYDDLVTVIKGVKKYLAPEGVFIFDLKTVKYFRSIGDNVIAEDRDECSFIWDNYFDESDNINEYQLSLFIKGDDGRYDKFVEEHYQQGYLIEEIKEAVKEAGMNIVSLYRAFSHENASEDDDRIYVVLKK